MIFIIPLILGGAALGTAAFGVFTGASGVSQMKEAEKIGKDAQRRHEKARDLLQKEKETTQELAAEYGQLQIGVKTKTIGRFIAFLERIGQKSSTDKRFLEGLDGISIEEIKEYKATALEAEKFAKGGFGAAAAGAAGGYGATTVATSVGVASTGTAISGLSGAAAWNATLAWLGGGSLAAGGGGMALGTLVLGGITVGPALAVAGFVIGGKGEKALTEAEEYKAKANVEIATLNEARDFLKQVKRRINELGYLVKDIDDRACLAMNELESRPFNKDRDAAKFQQVVLFIKALAEIMKTPVLDDEGKKLNPVTENIIEKYSTI
ncbi:MAG: hypothetical protein QNJ68_10950 [Microcoleaceae cyanobacterium MO_207.B10]|nr:hypothetical protein [Microcoleaceae cyanobacterium MO_207.B10]